MTEGYIYILFNPAYRANQYKIGMTTRTPEERALEVSSATGVPQSFEVLFSKRVADCQWAERLVHQRLAEYRSGSDREFFQVSLSIAIDILNDVTAEVGLLSEKTAVQEPSYRMTDPVTSGDIDLVPRKPSLGPTRKRQGIPEAPTCFEDHIAYTDALRQPLLREVRDRILAIDGRLHAGETVTPRQRIAYKLTGGTNFIEIKVQRSAILVRLPETSVVDRAGKVRKIPDTHGWGRLKDEIRISNASDVEYALPFIEAACRTELKNFE
ncbi:GIY-YIG nuclease family protein [Sinorhizobium fredii]|uniref:GIY-YIG nuclease family protein n=1 Tax=Rhizobium fredii TaxID=380 RepID=UPI0035120686